MVLDIDNTLCEDGSLHFAGDTLLWLKQLRKQGLGICLLSNAREKRAGEVASLLGLPYVSEARKPSSSGFQRALTVLGTDPPHTAVVGDQLFSEILGGNRMGMHTLLVEPVRRGSDPLVVRIKRPFERLFFRKKHRQKYEKNNAKDDMI